MNRNHLVRLAGAFVVAGLASLGVAPAAFAMIPLPPGGLVGTPVPPPAAVGMPGWQIALIAIAAALCAAVVAVLADRALARRRKAPTAPAKAPVQAR